MAQPLLAQMPTATDAQFLGWIVGALATVYAAKLVLDFYTGLRGLSAPAEPGKTYVTKTELDAVALAMKSDMAGMKAETKQEFIRMEVAVREMQEYSRNRFHELGNGIQALALKISEVRMDLPKEMANSLRPLVEKVEHNSFLVAQILGRTGRGDNPSRDSDPSRTTIE